MPEYTKELGCSMGDDIEDEALREERGTVLHLADSALHSCGVPRALT
jgi:hypothetical protein